MGKTPAYRSRKGYSQAIVTLTDSLTGKRRDYWLGEHGSRASKELYFRLLADWEAAGRRLPECAARPPRSAQRGPNGSADGSTRTVDSIIREYWRFARGYYTPSCASGIKVALRVLREHYGTHDAKGFGPNALRTVRDAMIHGRDDPARPRRPWCRKTVNTRVGHIVRMFRWAASREMVGPQVYQSLQTLPALRRGRSAAKDHEDVAPVPQPLIDAVKPLVSRQVRALIELQLLTGARPGELLGLRAVDIDTSDAGGVWAYRPRQHKNTHRGKDRAIFFGPSAQAVLREFMPERPLDAHLFSPADAEAERRAKVHARRRTPLRQGNSPGTNRLAEPSRRVGTRYTVASYRRAIQRACDEAFPPPASLAAEERPAWVARHRWHPHQLRHNAATQIRREFGLEAAQLVLGHSSALLTDAVYALRDEAKVVEVIRKLG